MVDGRKLEKVSLAATNFAEGRRTKLKGARDTSTVAAAIYDCIMGPHLPALQAVPPWWFKRESSVLVSFIDALGHGAVELNLPSPRILPYDDMPDVIPGIKTTCRWGLHVIVSTEEALALFGEHASVLRQWCAEDNKVRDDTYNFAVQVQAIMAAHRTVADALVTFPALRPILPKDLIPKRKSKNDIGRPERPELLDKVDFDFLSTIIVSGKMMGVTAKDD